MVSRRTPSLPDKFYLKDGNNCYYSVVNGIVTVDKKTPDPSCEVTVEYSDSNPDEFYLKTCQGGYFQFHKQQRKIKKANHIDHKPKKKKCCLFRICKKNNTISRRRIPFTLLDVEDTRADIGTFVFRADGAVNGKFLVLLVNPKNRVVLGNFEQAKIRIEDAAIKRLIGNINYDLKSAKVENITPEIATVVRNDPHENSSTVTQALSYTYNASYTGSWKNWIGEALPPDAVADVKIPCLVNGTIIIEEKYSRVDPESTRGGATVARIHVPFIYTETVWYKNGDYKELIKRGIYSNVVNRD